TTAQAATATTQPATAPAQAKDDEALLGDEPVIVRWEGELRVEPLSAEVEPPADGAAVLRVSGSPVRITREQSIIESAALMYDTATERLELTASAQHPVRLDGAGG